MQLTCVAYNIHNFIAMKWQDRIGGRAHPYIAAFVPRELGLRWLCRSQLH